MKTVTVISNYERKEYFFTTDHCQNHELGSEWVPCTHYLPSKVVPRTSLPSGDVLTKEDVVTIFYSDYKEIPNPNKDYQPRNPTFYEIKKFVSDWGESDAQTRLSLSYLPMLGIEKHLNENYFWFEEEDVWLPNVDTIDYDDDERIIATYIKDTFCTKIDEAMVDVIYEQFFDNLHKRHESVVADECEEEEKLN